MRLNRFLAAAGIGSHRHCDELIAGRVTIGGRVCTFQRQPDPTVTSRSATNCSSGANSHRAP
jgi:16S rRNA U516 pseudouridylate synthase RsuA-like enzyme